MESLAQALNIYSQGTSGNCGKIPTHLQGARKTCLQLPPDDSHMGRCLN